MSELHSSRRDVMRALAILPATIASPPAAHAAVELACTPAAKSVPPAFTSALVRAMRANHVLLFVYDGELETAFPEPGVAGRPERNECLDHIDGAQRALYKLMCAVPGAVEAVKSVIEGERQ